MDAVLRDGKKSGEGPTEKRAKIGAFPGNVVSLRTPTGPFDSMTSSGHSLEPIFNPVAVVETAIEKGAASILMPISSRRQLNDLPDDLAAKVTIHYYLDARDALLKALAI